MILVTGASGFIGREVCSAFFKRGFPVRGAVRSGASVPFIPGVDWTRVADCDGDTCWSQALAGVEVVVHCAGVAHTGGVQPSERPSLYRKVNVDGTRRLAEEAARARVRRMLFVSSVKAVGERSSPGVPLKVHDPANPEDDYGRSKFEAEKVLFEVGTETGLEVVIIRPPLVYGPGVGGNFHRLLSLVDRGLPLPFGSISNRRSMVFMKNLTDFILVCVEMPSIARHPYFVSDGEDVSVAELIRAIASAMGRPACLVRLPPALLSGAARMFGRVGEIERLTGTLQVDISANRELLGWSPPFRVEAGVRETVGWFRQLS